MCNKTYKIKFQADRSMKIYNIVEVLHVLSVLLAVPKLIDL